MAEAPSRYGETAIRDSHGLVSLVPALAGDPHFRFASRTEGHSIKPVTQQIGVTHRPRPACQHEKDGLERILGVLIVAQEAPAYEQDHRSVPRYRCGECRLTGGISVLDESIEELPVGHSRDRAPVE